MSTIRAYKRHRTPRNAESVLWATDEQVSAARAWAKGCQWSELAPELVINGVDDHHEGGWPGFVRASGDLYPEQGSGAANERTTRDTTQSALFSVQPFGQMPGQLNF